MPTRIVEYSFEEQEAILAVVYRVPVQGDDPLYNGTDANLAHGGRFLIFNP